MSPLNSIMMTVSDMDSLVTPAKKAKMKASINQKIKLYGKSNFSIKITTFSILSLPKKETPSVCSRASYEVRILYSKSFNC